jgi:phage baseplate assembly protein gpV
MDRREYLNDSEESLRLAMDDRAASIWTALPCIVSAVNLEANTISAQPAIQGAVSDENGNVANVNLPVLVDVPIVFPSAGGFSLTFPIEDGDEVLVIFASRCIDTWWQSGGIGKQAEARMHDLSDGFAIAGIKSQATKIANISSNSVQLRNNAGAAFIEINASGEIKLKSGSKIILDAPLVEMTGDLNVAGDSLAGTISLKTHTHSGVQNGGGNTGAPN